MGKKEITHAEARAVVQYLRDCCAENRSRVSLSSGKSIKVAERSLSTIICSWQTYLIIKFLVFLPVRQQELRQLKFGKTLIRKIDDKGNPYYEAKISEHKNKKKTGKPRQYKLPDILTADLDAWIYTWRPKAIEAVQTLENWLRFVNYDMDDVEQLQKRIEIAKQGHTERKVKDIQKYLKQLETRLLALENRIDALPSAKANLTEHDSLFFLIGQRFPQSFGKPLSQSNVYSLVTNTMAKAATALFGEPRRTNPHAFRHIAAKHIRLINGDAKGLAHAIGHSEKQGEQYANQIMSDLDQLINFSDNWWE
jgi:integrase